MIFIYSYFLQYNNPENYCKNTCNFDNKSNYFCTSSCPKLNDKFNDIPNLFKNVKYPKQYFCGKRIIENLKQTQEKAFDVKKYNLTDLFAPPRLKNMIKKEQKERDKKIKKLEKNILNFYLNIEDVLNFLSSNNYNCYHTFFNILNKKTTIFNSQIYYNFDTNLMIFLEFFYQLGKEGKLNSFIITNKETIINQKVKLIKEV